METNSRPEATASPVKQGQYSPRKRKDTTPKVNPQLAVELVYQELKRVEAYTKRIEKAMEKGSQLEMSIEELNIKRRIQEARRILHFKARYFVNTDTPSRFFNFNCYI